MGAVNTTYTFTPTDTITSTKMNNIIDETMMTTDAIIGTTLEISSGKLRIRSGGITSNEMGANSVATNSIADSNVTTAKIADSNVTTAKIADSAITTAKIGDSQVTTVKIGDSQITTAKIANANVTAEKLNGAQTGSAPVFGVRAWVTFDMTRNASGGSDLLNTDRFIIGSGNVSSVTKTATGRFTVNFTTALPNTNYVACGSGMGSDSSGDIIIGRPLNSTKTTSAIALSCLNAGDNDRNFEEVGIIVIG